MIICLPTQMARTAQIAMVVKSMGWEEGREGGREGGRASRNKKDTLSLALALKRVRGGGKRGIMLVNSLGTMILTKRTEGLWHMDQHCNVTPSNPATIVSLQECIPMHATAIKYKLL